MKSLILVAAVCALGLMLMARAGDACKSACCAKDNPACGMAQGCKGACGATAKSAKKAEKAKAKQAAKQAKETKKAGKKVAKNTAK